MTLRKLVKQYIKNLDEIGKDKQNVFVSQLKNENKVLLLKIRFKLAI